jgi:gluconate 2-dehydrogenase gamma chain
VQHDFASNGSLSRREMIRLSIVGSAAGVLASGCSRPRIAARSIFSDDERAWLAATADTLVPGAAAAKVVDFVAAMLSDPEPMLCYGFVSFPMPPEQFYRAALSAIADLSRRSRGKSPDALTPHEREELIGRMLAPKLSGWAGPPPGLVYFVIRNDAIDAVYGGEDAYERLDVPYMAHIAPPGRW